MSNWKDIEQLTPDQQEKARKQFSPTEIASIGDYEFAEFGVKLQRRVRRSLVKDHVPSAESASRSMIVEKTRSMGPTAAAVLLPSDDRILLDVPIAELMPSPLNPRRVYAEAATQELAANLRAVGVVQALVVRSATAADAARGFRFEVVAGHRRLKAAAVANLPAVPVQVREMSDAIALDVMLSENLQREDLNVIEEAEGLDQWLKLPGKDGAVRTILDAAVMLGKTEQHVLNSLRLLRLPKKATEALESGTIGAATGYIIAKVPTAELRKRLAEEVLRGHGEGAMSKREVIDHVRRSYMVELRGSPFDQRDATLVPIKEKDGERIAGGACTDCPLNTANMADASEGKMNLCTNPGCYQAKVDSHVAHVKSKAVSDGKLVIEGERANRYIYHDGTPHYDSGMIRLDQSPSAAEMTGTHKAPVWKKMLDGEVKPKVTVVIDQKGKAHELVERKLAIEAAKKNGFNDLFSARATRAKNSGHAEQMERESKERQEQKLVSATAGAALDELVAAIGKQGVAKETWSAILELAFFHVGADGEAFVCHRRELTVPKNEHGQADREKALREHAATLSVERLPGFAIELLLGGWMKHRGVDAPAFALLATAYKVDVKTIAARVKQDLKAKKKPAEKAKPAKAAKAAKVETPVRELIAELAQKRRLSLLQINQVAQETIGKNYEFAKGPELVAIADAIKALPVPEKKKKAVVA